MLYFVLNVRDRRVVKTNPLYKEFEEEFAIRENIYFDKRPEYERLLKENKMLVADIAAAVTTSLFQSGFTDSKYFIGKQLDLCRNTIVSTGFQELYEEKLTATLGSCENVVLVPGCQDEDMLNRRIECLVKFTILEKRPLTVVFSGRNPGNDDITIENEADRMRIAYERIVRQRQKEIGFDIKIRSMNKEEQSVNTKENIDKFLSADDFFNKRKKHNIVIVSSTFHLIRIAEHFQTCVLSDHFEISKFAENIILIGAEDGETLDNELSQKKVMSRYWEKPYIKLMMFDLFRKHMT